MAAVIHKHKRNAAGDSEKVVHPSVNYRKTPSYYCQQSAYFVTVFCIVGDFLCGVERLKRFLNVHLHRIVSNLKRISNISTLPPPGIFSADAHAYSMLLCLGKFLRFDDLTNVMLKWM